MCARNRRHVIMSASGCELCEPNRDSILEKAGVIYRLVYTKVLDIVRVIGAKLVVTSLGNSI